MEYRIKAEESDSQRDQFVCEYLEEITFTKNPDGIIKLLTTHSDTSVASALELIGINYWRPKHSDLESVSDTTWHAFLCRDFSVMICAWDYCATESNNIAILGLEKHSNETGKKHIVSTSIGHKAVIEPLQALEKRF